MKKRRIGVFTGSRADYGLLSPLIECICNSSTMELFLIVSGTHLNEDFGKTQSEILDDGFIVSAEIDLELASDSAVSVIRGMGVGLIKIANALEGASLDIIVILGDRYEALVAAQAAMILGVPIAHIHGGELTLGLVDDAIRHSITKMSHLHFVAAQEYRDRVIQLGETPSNVYVVGALALDNIEKIKQKTLDEMSSILGVELIRPVFLVTYHPVTLQKDGDADFADDMLSVLHSFGGTTIVTGTNADMSGQKIRQTIKKYASNEKINCHFFENLGVEKYLQLVCLADLVVGNSSSGVIEAPLLGRPSINIGRRQLGRLMAPSVLSCSSTAEELREKIHIGLSKEHLNISGLKKTPYGTSGAAPKIALILENVECTNLINKTFYNLKVAN